MTETESILSSGLIFISYRRSDSRYVAAHIRDHLVQENVFGTDAVFMDFSSIYPGGDFREYIEQALSHCKVLLAVMGSEWLNATDKEGNRRLDDANDWVRIEIEQALHRKILVIPVCVDGTQMPKADDLPSSIKELAYRQAVDIRSGRYLQRDLQILVEDIKDHLGLSERKKTRREIIAQYLSWGVKQCSWRRILTLSGTMALFMGIATLRHVSDKPVYTSSFQLGANSIFSSLVSDSTEYEEELIGPEDLIILKSPFLLEQAVEELKDSYPSVTYSEIADNLELSTIDNGSILTVSYLNTDFNLTKDVLEELSALYIQFSRNSDWEVGFEQAEIDYIDENLPLANVYVSETRNELETCRIEIEGCGKTKLEDIKFNLTIAEDNLETLLTRREELKLNIASKEPWVVLNEPQDPENTKPDQFKAFLLQHIQMGLATGLVLILASSRLSSQFLKSIILKNFTLNKMIIVIGTTSLFASIGILRLLVRETKYYSSLQLLLPSNFLDSAAEFSDNQDKMIGESEVLFLTSSTFLTPTLQELRETGYPNQTYAEVADNLQVLANGSVLTVTYTSDNPDLANSTLDYLANTYQNVSLEIFQRSFRSRISFLEEQIPVLRNRVDFLIVELEQVISQECGGNEEVCISTNLDEISFQLDIAQKQFRDSLIKLFDLRLQLKLSEAEPFRVLIEPSEPQAIDNSDRFLSTLLLHTGLGFMLGLLLVVITSQRSAKDQKLEKVLQVKKHQKI